MKKFLSKLLKPTTIFIALFFMFLPSFICSAEVSIKQNIDKNKIWTIKFSSSVLLNEETKNNIKVKDSNGKEVNVSVTYGSDDKSIQVCPPQNGYTSGETYTLTIGSNCKSKHNKTLKNDSIYKFTIKQEDSLQYMNNILSPYYNTLWNFKMNFTDKYMSMNGKQYQNGYQLYSGWSKKEVSFNLNGKYKEINGLLGLDDSQNTHDATLEIMGDGRLLTNYELKAGSSPQQLNVNVENVNKLSFILNSESYLDLVDLTILGPSSPNNTIDINPNVLYVSDSLTPYYNTLSSFHSNPIEKAINMGATEYLKGYQFYPGWSEGKIAFNLEGRYNIISGFIGLDDSSNKNDSSIQIFGDGKFIAKYDIKAGSLPQPITINVAGVNKLSFNIKGESLLDLANLIFDKTPIKSTDNPTSNGTYMSDILNPYFNSMATLAINPIDHSMNMGCKEYLKGYQLYPGWSEGKAAFNLEGKYEEISGLIGLDDTNNRQDATLQVFGDDKFIKKIELTSGALPIPFTVNTKTIKKLSFVVTGSSSVDLANVTIEKSNSPVVDTPNNVNGTYMSDILSPYYNTMATLTVNPVKDFIKMGCIDYIKGYQLYAGYDKEEAAFNLDGKYNSISGLIGLDDSANRNDTSLQVFCDDKFIKKYDLISSTLPIPFNVDVRNVKKLSFVVNGYSKVSLANVIIDSDPNYVSIEDKNETNEKYMSDTFNPVYNTLSNFNTNPIKNSMEMGSKTYLNGYQLYAGWSEHQVDFNLDSGYKALTGLIGLDDSQNKDETAVKIYQDNNFITKYTLTPGMLPQQLNLNVDGVKRLSFVVDGSSYVDIVKPILK